MNKRVVLYISIICSLGALMLLTLWAPHIEKIFSPKPTKTDSVVWSSDGWYEVIPQKNINPVPEDSAGSPLMNNDKESLLQPHDSTSLVFEQTSDPKEIQDAENDSPRGVLNSVAVNVSNKVVNDSLPEKKTEKKSLYKESRIVESIESKSTAKSVVTDSAQIRTAQQLKSATPVVKRDSLNQVDGLSQQSEQGSMIDSLLAEILAAQDSMRSKVNKPQKTTIDSVLFAKRRTVGVELGEMIYGKERKKTIPRDPVSFSGMKSENVSLATNRLSNFTEPANKGITGKSGYNSWQIGLTSGPSQHQSQANGTLGGLTSCLFLDYFVTPDLSLGAKVGVGRLALSDSYTSLQTQIVRADLSIKYHITATETVKPFISLGLALDHFDAARIDSQIAPMSFASFVAGTGVHIGVSQHLSLFVSGEFRFINGQVSDNSQSNDSSASAQIGFSYRFHQKSSSETGKDLLASKSISFP
jgi:hypothetical protein